MTHHGSNSDRPRGRRARPGGDWPGYDEASREEREFPDLQPIRPRGSHGRHSAPDAQPRGGPQTGGPLSGGPLSGGPQGAGQPGWDERQGAGRTGQAPWGPAEGFQQAPPSRGRYGQSGPQPSAPGYPPSPQREVQYGDAQYGDPQYGQPRYSPPGPAGPRHSAPQPAVPQPAVPPGAGRPRPGADQGWDDQESDDPMSAFSERWRRRGQEGPQDEGKRRRLYVAVGAVAAIAIAVGVYFFTSGSGGAANTGIGSLVTTFLPGELQQVPNACTSVPSATLKQDLPGQLRQAAPPLNAGAQSQCTWTLDNAPTYRVLEVSMTAYSPSGLASGDGSATFAAEDAYAEAEALKQKPGSKSGQPRAAVANVSSLGSSAFSATQKFDENGAVMDMATVYVRYRNVIIQVVLNGIDHSSGPRQYGPVSQSQLLSEAKSVAQQVTAKVTG